MRPSERAARFSNTTAPGGLLKRLLGLHTRLRIKQTVERDATYLVRVRELPCLKCGLEPCGEAAHVRRQSGAFNKRSGLAQTPSDKWALPLCAGCHRADPEALHRIGETVFFDRLQINPLLICEKLYAARGDQLAMRAVIFTAMIARAE